MDHVEFGGCERSPAARRPLTFTATALGVCDRFVRRQPCALVPCGIELVIAQDISQYVHQSLVAVVENLESHQTKPLPDRMRSWLILRWRLVEQNGLGFEVGQQTFAAALAADPGLFESAERDTHREPKVVVADGA